MKGLTAKEEEIMGFFWEKGPLFVKEMLAFYEDPKPHFNTLSTIVRGLEVCTESVCTYFTFSKEKSKDEMHFSKCDVESEEILPLI